LSLVNWLCEEAECNLYVNDLDALMMKPITDKYMEVFMKDYMERLQQLGVEEEAGEEPQPQPQQPPPQQQFVHGEGSSQQGAYRPIHPIMLDYMFGYCN